MQLHGLHHVTAVTGQAAKNVTFYTEVLGLRLVKKTVNQDDLSAYHLFYGDAVGNPGTELTFFDWPQAIGNRPGIGTVTATGLRVPGSSLNWWLERFKLAGVAHDMIADRAGRLTLPFTDPEGQRFQLVDDGNGTGGTPWPDGPVPPEVAIRGLGPATLTLADAEPTVSVLTRVLGFRAAGEYMAPDDGRPVLVYSVGPGGPGAELHLAVRPQSGWGAVGIGGVHHIAFRTPDEAEHRAWQQRIAAAGLGVTPVIDRYYFRSIYFREPGGVLFEIATDGPGFTSDEDVEHLGERLSLPPFLEPRRAAIEAGLRPLPMPARTAAAVDVLTQERVAE
ncbi:MAG TPA: ring-cleaving dioxygenase [Chloroflexota bacterium]|nr:ring-cleaving dioxygenase [Chloroflexota bacterium]